VKIAGVHTPRPVAAMTRTAVAAAVLAAPFFFAAAPAAWAQEKPRANSATEKEKAAKEAHRRELFKATTRHPFDDVKHWTRVFDDPDRDGWQRPRAVVASLELRKGMTVADLGAGTGYFSRYLSEAVGPEGRVYAADTEPNLVAHLRKRAEKEGNPNVTPILASADDPRLPAGAVDVVFIVNTFHHIDDRLVYFGNLRRALKERGRVAIVEWHKRPLPVGPKADHKIEREQVVEEMETAGYYLVEEPVFLPYQYFLIFLPRR